MRIPREQGLVAHSVIAAMVLLASITAMYFLLVQLELQKSLSFSNKLEFDEDDDGDGATPSGNTPNSNSNTASTKTDEIVEGRMIVTRRKKVFLLGLVLLTVALLFLILVYNNIESTLIAWIGMGAVLILLYFPYISDEFGRRRRMDRMSALLTIVLIVTTCLHWLFYAQTQVARGQIYKGPARIVGYDETQYERASKAQEVTRTDLTVAFGGAWACPHKPDLYCNAYLEGALCYTRMKEDSSNADSTKNNNNNRRVLEQLQGGEESEEIDTMKEENEQLRQENAEDKEIIEEYEDYTEQLEEEIQEVTGYTYYYDDDKFDKGYWDAQDWNAVWGQYACEDLFAQDLAELHSYDPDTDPGDDSWPTVNIYGDCDTCEAFIVDYFSTEYYENVLDHKFSTANYAIASILGIFITSLLVMRQRLNPTADQEIELLSRHGKALS